MYVLLYVGLIRPREEKCGLVFAFARWNGLFSRCVCYGKFSKSRYGLDIFYWLWDFDRFDLLNVYEDIDLIQWKVMFFLDENLPHHIQWNKQIF